MSLPARLDAVPRPSFLAVEVTLASVPYVALLAVTVVFQPILLDPARTDSAAGTAVFVGLVGLAAMLGLAVVVLVHALVDAVGIAREWPPDGDVTARRAGHVGVRVAETVLAAGFLVVAHSVVTALSGDVPAPAGVGAMLLFGGAYFAFSGVVVLHGAGRLLLTLADRS